MKPAGRVRGRDMERLHRDRQTLSRAAWPSRAKELKGGETGKQPAAATIRLHMDMLPLQRGTTRFTNGYPSQYCAAGQRVSPLLKLLAVALRSVFLVILAALAVRASLPQAESIWTIYDEPRDAVRLALGFVVIVWIVDLLFRRPRDAQGYRTWVYLGAVLVPLTLAALVAFW
jgi:hypothetical protein